MTTMADKATRHPNAELAAVPVAEVMHGGVLTCPLETPIRDVARMMAKQRVHCIVAAEESEDDGERRLWGVVSDLDLVSAASAGSVDDLTAGGTAVTPVLMVSPDDTVEHAAQLMAEHAVSHLVVVDSHHSRPVGVVSTLDVAALLAGPLRREES